MHLRVYTDGGARGNPGPAGCGFVVFGEDSTVLEEGYKPLGHTTNNQAEYQGAIHGLYLALKHKPKKITLHMDSELVVKQLRGEYKVKNPQIREIYVQVQNLMKDYTGDLEIVHVRRDQNAYADNLSNKAMDLVN